MLLVTELVFFFLIDIDNVSICLGLSNWAQTSWCLSFN